LIEVFLSFSAWGRQAPAGGPYLQTSSDLSQALLGVGDPAPVAVINQDGRAPALLVCEHAGRAVPAALNRLGLADDAFARHVAWDIGAEAVARIMAEALDAPLVIQRYSRLVVDCNRPAAAPDVMPAVSDGVVVPGNRDLDAAGRSARWDAIHAPFHAEVAACLDAALARGRVALVTIHSFTPALATVGLPRPWHIGLLARETRLAHPLMDRLLAERPGLVAAFNEPYRITDPGDYTIPVHAEPRGVPHVLVEIRNDLIAETDGQRDWAALMTRALAAVLPTVLEQPVLEPSGIERDPCQDPT